MSLPSLDAPEWQRLAACRRADPELFYRVSHHYDDAGHHNRPQCQLCKALGVCAGCPVTVECLLAALTIEGEARSNRYGVWGGMTPNARQDLYGVYLEARTTNTDTDDTGDTQ